MATDRTNRLSGTPDEVGGTGFGMTIDELRRYALSLPDATEEPHFHLTSLRVRGKIFATFPADSEYVNVFASEEEREVAIASDPEVYAKLWWGKKVVGVRIALAKARAPEVRELLRSAWCRKAPKTLRRIEQSLK